MEHLNVLLIEDDEDDFVIVRDLLSEIRSCSCHLEWVSERDTALDALKSSVHDICLLDYRLGETNGLEILEDAMAAGCELPLILLTGYGDYEVDVRATRSGAADFLPKDQMTSHVLERAVRHALEHKQARDALKKERDRFMNILESMHDPVYIIDWDYTLRYINPVGTRLFGPQSAARCYEYFHGRRDPCPWCKNSRVMRGETVRWEWTTADGRTYDIFDTPLLNSDGTIHKLGILHDISEYKRVSEALYKSEEKYRMLVENAASIIMTMDSRGRITFCNEFGQRFFGLTEAEMLGRSPVGMIVPDRPESRSDLAFMIQDIVMHPERYECNESEITLRSGRTAWIAWTNKVIQDDRERLTGILSIGYDITERKLAEKTLRESERQLRFLSSKLLTAQEEERKRIARELHDSIGSSLSAIKFSLEQVLERLDEPEAVRKSVEALIGAAANAIEESRRIMTDLRPSILDDLGIVVTIGWFCRQCRSIYSGILITEDISVDEADIPEHLKIVIFRIIQEAMNNMAKYSKAGEVRLSLGMNEERIELTVADNGRGFDLHECLSREGTRKGLGITSMKERTELSGGTFSIETGIGRGTLIRACWP